MDTGGIDEAAIGVAGTTGHPHCGQTYTESASSAPHSWQWRFFVADMGHPHVGHDVTPLGISVPHSLQMN